MALEFKANVIEKSKDTINLGYFIENTRIVFDHETNTFSILILTYDKTKENSACSGIVLNHWLTPESDSEFDLKYQYFQYFLDNFNAFPLSKYTDKTKKEYVYPYQLDSLIYTVIAETKDISSNIKPTSKQIFWTLLVISLAVFAIVDLLIDFIIALI